jgi:hypothetical protein
VATDLPGHTVERGPGGALLVTPPTPSPRFVVDRRVERRFLGRTEIAQFSVRTESAFPERCHLRVRHTGGRRRTGLEASVREGGQAADVMAERVTKDDRLVQAAMPLDFTRFDIRSDSTGWETTVELMGATLVAIALPPVRSYVRLYPDQREALRGTLTELTRVLNGAIAED